MGYTVYSNKMMSFEGMQGGFPRELFKFTKTTDFLNLTAYFTIFSPKNLDRNWFISYIYINTDDTLLGVASR